jgi:folate-dependent phosphoribosylglycinamide formyltransferase PurN
MKNFNILLFASESKSTNIIFHALKEDYPSIKVIIELKSLTSKINFWKSRVGKLGYSSVVGQILFLLLVDPFLKVWSVSRINSIKKIYGLDSSKIDPAKIRTITHIHSVETTDLINSFDPDIIIINGTSILPITLIENVHHPIINIHTGITPSYRGIQGAYWALVQKDDANCGVTVHFVDAGIDTGKIISQATINPSPEDNYSTYPYLQIALGIQLLKKCLLQIKHNQLQKEQISKGNTKCWTHPTIWEYFKNRLILNVK